MNKIINFHEIKDSIWFEEVIVYLKSKYNIITTSQLYDFYYNHISLKNVCMITVDDGHISSYDIIYPILKKYRVPAIFFVSPEIAKREKITNFWFQEIEDYDKTKLTQIAKKQFNNPNLTEIDFDKLIVGSTIDDILEIISKYQELYSIGAKEPQNMTIPQILQIDKEGLVEIGAHTMYHPLLSRESDLRSKEEIQFSISQLEEILQHPILTFAYPNGRPIVDWDVREIEYLKETSVKLAFSTYHHNFSLSDNVFAIPRYGLSSGSLRFIRLKLFLGKYYPYVKKLLRR